MERKKAMIASAIIAVTVMSGAVAYAASSGITNSRSDNVGQLQPTATQPTTITVVVDPVTGKATNAAPLPAAAEAPGATSQRSGVDHYDDRGSERQERESEDGDD